MMTSLNQQKEHEVNNSHVSALRIKHADLESKLEREENRPMPDSKLILDIKKQKLQIKDVLAHEPTIT
jgi:hypothetical protein